MSTGYGWEGIRQVCATLLGARHVPERLCGGPWRYNKCSTFTAVDTGESAGIDKMEQKLELSIAIAE